MFSLGTPWRRLFLFAVSLSVWLAVLVYIHAGHLQTQVVDEAVHIPQIRSFLEGRFAIHPWLSMIPGYHLLVAGIMWALGMESVYVMRVISATFGLLACLLFYRIRLTLGDSAACRRATSFFFLPLLFPYDFLVYTDALSLLLVLVSLLAMLKQRHLMAALVITAAIAVRQNNVVWAGFLALFAVFPLLMESRWRPWQNWRDILPIVTMYLFPVVAFVAYWAWNGTIAYSKVIAQYHPDNKLHLGNVYFTLFLLLVFFPCHAMHGAKRLMLVIRRKPWLILVLLLCVASIKLRGSWDNYAAADYFVRNAIIEAVRSGWPRYIFAIAVVLGAAGMMSARFIVPPGWLVYPFSAVYLSSSWLIENRYSIIPVALWMALRKVECGKCEQWTSVWWLAMSLFFVWGIFGMKFML